MPPSATIAADPPPRYGRDQGFAGPAWIGAGALAAGLACLRQGRSCVYGLRLGSLCCQHSGLATGVYPGSGHSVSCGRTVRAGPGVARGQPFRSPRASIALTSVTASAVGRLALLRDQDSYLIEIEEP